ncbi:uncharacterized protein [Epargyreus clarus]|uniref:uncharacterized protein n=1 Tax=Epargyreus clarus TaxID=520877 RepID=UPI003C2BA548
MSCIEFTVNGQKCSVDTCIPRDTTLNAYLRYHLALPGTKAMCHQGACGACLVAVRAYNHTDATLETFSVNSCLVLVFACHGWDITTIEGVGNKTVGYNTIQKRTALFNATQCGYCTVGWEMQLYSLLDKRLTMAELEDSFGSNTCRCTGYRPILDTIKSFATDASPELCQKIRDIEDLTICKKTNKICERKCSTSSEGSDWSIINEFTSSPGDDIIYLNFGVKKYFKVFTKQQIFQILTQHGVNSYMLVDGNTARGILGIYDLPSMLIDIRDVGSLKQYEFDQNLILGANITLQDCITLFKEIPKTRSEFAYLNEFAKHLLLVAQIPVRKNGSLAGNFMLKHRKPDFQSDLFVLFATVGATMIIEDIQCNKRYLSMPEFLKQDMCGAVIVSFQLPPFGRTYVFKSYKILPRSQNALAIVNAGFLLKINAKNIIEYASIVYGNISASFIYAKRTQAYLIGKNILNNAVLQGAISLLNVDIVPTYDPAKPSPACRKKLAIGLFYKFVLSICPVGFASPRLQSGANLLERPVSSGKQEFQTDPTLYPLNEPVPKYEAIIQSSGEARYANDIPPMTREVFAAFVQATVYSGAVDRIDASEVLKMEGVIAMYTAKDIPGVNSFTYPGIQLQTEDEVILASNNIQFHGQPVGIIVAESEALAAKAATLVKVTYKNANKGPPVLTINEAKKDSTRVIPSDSKIEPKGRGTNVKKVIKGVYEIGAQYHYYMEPMTCVVIPADQGLVVYDSSQWMDLTQIAISRCLNMKECDIIVKVLRIGGGFGGKISRNVQASTSCALVAVKTGRPCRFILPMRTNLTIAGRRLACQCAYEVGVDDLGKIQYLNASILEDAGCTNNEDIMSYTAGGFPNCYNTDNFSLTLATVLTNLPSNTFARAPGTHEGISCIEHIMEHIAFEVKRDPTAVRLVNMRTDDNDLPQLIETLKKEAEYDRRYKEIQQFNEANRWVKKAMNIAVMLFPVVFYGNYTAAVAIYRADGTVTVTTGGVEMGQGANTKARQVCAYELGISIENVSVLPHYNFVAANNIFSGSSIVSECVCYAVIRACAILKERLKPIRDTLTNPTWLEVIKKAGDEQVDLFAEYMMTDKEPDLEGYSAFTVTILEGELDVTTGRYLLNRVDILEDVGLSTNPTIDIGQVEGAYVQGLGYYTMEEFRYDKKTGALLSNDALSYEVYLAKDIPVDMRVKLRYNSKNVKGVLGSKAVGEMGICTSNGVIHMLRQCIMESRKDSGYDPNEWIDIEIPYTTESILKALNVKDSEFVLTT